MSREIVEALSGTFVIETSQAGLVVVSDEVEDVAVSLLVGVEAVLALVFSVGRLGIEMVLEAAVEPLNHAVRLGPEGPGELMADAVCGADPVEGVPPGGRIGGLALLVDGEAVGELRAIVGEHGVDLQREAGQEAFEEGGGIGGAAGWSDLEIDVACGPVDGDEGIGGPALEPGEVFDIDMDEAGRVTGLEAARRSAFGGGPGGQAMTFPAAVKRGARQVRLHTAPHHFQGIVQRQSQIAAQGKGESLFMGQHGGLEHVGGMRTVMDFAALTPAPDRGLGDPQFARQIRHPAAAGLDHPARRRGRARIRVKPDLHHPALRLNAT